MGRTNDECGNIRQRQHVHQNAESSADAWHAIDCATGFILPERKATLTENGGHAGRSIRAHSSHDYTEGE
jgi:hypothetical protein